MTISKKIQNCRKNNDFELGIELLTNNQLNIENVNTIISIYVNNFSFLKNSYKIEDIISLISNYDHTLKCQFITIYCYNNDINQAFNILQEIKHEFKIFKRKMYLPFINYYNTNNCRKYLDIIINDIISNNIELEPDDYIIFIKILNNITYKNLFLDIINYSISKRILLNEIDISTNIINNKCSKCQTKLEQINIENDIYKHIMSRIEIEVSKNDKTFSSFKTWCNKYSFIDTVIDGGNIGYFNNSKSKYISISQINRLINQISSKKIKLFLHNRHIKNLNERDSQIIKTWKKKNLVYLTKSKINDDYYWLYFSLFQKMNNNKINIISNDDIKDHIFKLGHNLKYIRDEIQVKYELDNLKFKLEYPSSYSKVTQISGEYVHLPTISNKWLCIKIS
jgi:hypothetical protein